jgi:hypothetical protein
MVAESIVVVACHGINPILRLKTAAVTQAGSPRRLAAKPGTAA